MKSVSVKKDLKKAELSEQIARHLLANGFSESGMRTLAQAAGTSDRMLIYYFGTKNQLITDVLELIAAKFLSTLDSLIGPETLPPSELLSRLTDEILSYEMRPLLLFWYEIVGFAVRGEQPYKDVAHRMMREWQAWTTQKLQPRHRHKGEDLFAQLEGRVLIHVLTED